MLKIAQNIEIHWTHLKNKTFTEFIAEYFDYSTFWQCKNQKEQWSSPDMHQSLPTMHVCTLHTVTAGPWLWKGLRSVLTSDQGRQPSNGLFDVQYVNHVILFVHCAHIYFLLSVCLCAPVHVLVSQSRLFMGIWRAYYARLCVPLLWAWEWSPVGELCAWPDLPFLPTTVVHQYYCYHYSSPNFLASRIPPPDNYLPPKYVLLPLPVCPSAKTCMWYFISFWCIGSFF